MKSDGGSFIVARQWTYGEGHGLTDLVRIRNGEVCYWPNKGYGRFGAKVTMSRAPRFDRPGQFDPKNLYLADISGTGATDLIYLNGTGATAWVNLSGNGWGEAQNIPYLPPADGQSRIAVLDFLGNGTGCIVWSSPLPQHADAPLRYIDLMGGKKPYLMDNYRNGMGKTVALQYKSSSQFYLEDKKRGIHWATRLPFPVHCIHKITTADSVSETRYTQSYRYRHGYYDHGEREFRGFGYVETLDTDSAVVNGGSLDQHPVLTKTWYHTGAWVRGKKLLEQYKKEYFQFEGWDDMVKVASLPAEIKTPQELREAYRALKGSPLRQEVYARDGSEQEDIPYTVTATAYKVQKIQGLASNRHAVFPNLQEQSVVFSCERDAADPRILHELVLETDEYGNVLQSAQVAYPRKHIPVGLPQKVKDEQAKMHITCGETNYTTDAIDEVAYSHYRLRVPYEAKSYEASFDEPEATLYTVAEMKDHLDNATPVDYTVTPSLGKIRLLSHTKTLFLADNAVTVKDEGEIESLALPYESYTLAFTPGVLSHCYDTRVNATMLAAGGYVDLDDNGNYWLPSGRATYEDPEANFYTPHTYTDPWGNETQITFNGSSYWLLPESITDAKGNVTEVVNYDWRTLQPTRMKDANDNIREMLYDALGFPVAMAVKGKDDGTEGDSLAALDIDSTADKLSQEAFWDDPEANAEDLLKDATWRCVYDLDNLPTGVAMIGRTHHTLPIVIPTEEGSLIAFTYSDGFGREIMQKVQCESITSVIPTEAEESQSVIKSWIGSGRTIYNNKGNAVMQYEPYFSSTQECDTAEQAAADGVSPKIYYDPLDRNYRTELPDGSFSKSKHSSKCIHCWICLYPHLCLERFPPPWQ